MYLGLLFCIDNEEKRLEWWGTQLEGLENGFKKMLHFSSNAKFAAVCFNVKVGAESQGR